MYCTLKYGSFNLTIVLTTTTNGIINIVSLVGTAIVCCS